MNIFDPELVVIGGGVSVAGELLLAPAKEMAARFIIQGVGTQTRIELARYGPRAGVRGAACSQDPDSWKRRAFPSK